MASISGTTSASSSYLRELQQELEEELRRSRQNSDTDDSRREERVAEMKEKLEADGIKIDRPYTKVPALGIAIAFIKDPWGTNIERTEGVDQIKEADLGALLRWLNSQ